MNNQGTFFTLTTDGRYLLRSSGTAVDSYELAIKDPSVDKYMLEDKMSKS